MTPRDLLLFLLLLLPELFLLCLFSFRPVQQLERETLPQCRVLQGAATPALYKPP